MKTLKTTLLLVALSTALITSVNAQMGCCGGGSSCKKGGSSSQTSNQGAHGGEVKAVGKYKIEMVYQPLMKQDQVIFYLMNKKGKPVSNKEITGKAEITYSDKSNGTITLEQRGENSFAGQMVNKTGSFICLLTLTINGENVTARFDGGTSGKENPTAQATYTCPMHPEVQSDKPGDCPKCGMTLVKQ